MASHDFEPVEIGSIHDHSDVDPDDVSPLLDGHESVRHEILLADTESCAENVVYSSHSYLYASHFLSRWGNRMWEFAVGLFMIQVFPESLLLAAVYGLVEAAAIAALGVMVGEWVDNNRSRLKVVKISLGVQNSSIIVAAVAVAALLVYVGSMPGGVTTFIILIVIVNLCGALAALSGLANNIVVERDWVVVICQGQSSGALAQMNSTMKRIDLFCKLVAPILVGFLMSLVSALSCAVMIGAWNAASVGVEYWLLHSVYWSTPGLHDKGIQSKDYTSQETLTLSSDAESQGRDLTQKHHNVAVQSNNADFGAVKLETRSVLKKLINRLFNRSFFEGWKTYLRQEVVAAGLALALLYFTVLSFGTLMTAVLNWRGIPAYVLGLARGVAAIVGILATVTYPAVQSKLQTVRTGLWAIWIQWTCLSLCALSLFFHTGILPSVLLIGGVAASRFGLWMFDLAVTQLMQESIAEHERGVVGGVQSSLQSIMDMLSYVVAVAISNPKDFWIPVVMSYGVVGLAATLYASYVHRVRNHLFHLDQLWHKLGLLNKVL